MRKFILIILLISTKVEATTYYVRQGGSDGNSCATATTDSNGTAKQTIQNAIDNCLGPGNTILVHTGTYIEQINPHISGGTDWNAGKARVAAYPGTGIGTEIVTVRPNIGTGDGLNAAFIGNSNTPKFIEFDGINFDGTNVAGFTFEIQCGASYSVHHIRIQNAEIIGPDSNNGVLNSNQGSTILIYNDPSNQNCGGNNEILNNQIHEGGHADSTTSSDHEIYVATSNNLIQGNNFYHSAGACVQLWNQFVADALMPVASGSTNNTVKNNLCHDSRNGGVTAREWGIVSGAGQNNTYYNNVIWNILTNKGCISMSSSPGDQAYNNTCYHNQAAPCIEIDNSITGIIVRNNICYQNGNDNVVDGGSGSIIQNNLVGGTDPVFVNPAAQNFQLQATSPARNAGQNTGPGTLDILGVTRPQEAIYDEGAYEFQPAGGNAITMRARGLIR